MTTTSNNGWQLDGRLIYRLDESGCNADEIVVTRSGGTTSGAVLAAAAAALRDAMCAAGDDGAQLATALRMNDGLTEDVACWVKRWSVLAAAERRNAAFLAAAKDFARGAIDSGGAANGDAAAAMLQCFKDMESGAKPAPLASAW